MTTDCLLFVRFAFLAAFFALPPSSGAADEPVDPLVEMVLGLLDDEDKEVRALGLEQLRTEAKGQAATKQFAAQLPNLPADGQVALVRALSDRGDAAARPAVLELLDADGEESVRVAAIEALGSLGELADLQILLKLLTDGSQAEQAAARSSLTHLPDESLSKAIVAEMQGLPTALRVTLIEILADRRAFDTIPDILNMALESDPSIRAAALTALGKRAGPEHIPGMVQGVLAAERGRERETAEKCVMFVCRRIEDTEKQAEPLLLAMGGLNESDRMAMLSSLGRVGGRAARRIIEQDITSSDRELHAAGLRALCNWPDGSVASRLAEVARTDPHPDHRTTALRALIRVAPLPDGRADVQKLEWLQNALAICDRDTERLLVLQRASTVRIPETLRFLLPYLDQPAYAQQACQAIVELAHHRELRDGNKAEFHAALDRVLEVSRDATVLERADRYKKGQTWVRPTAP